MTACCNELEIHCASDAGIELARTIDRRDRWKSPVYYVSAVQSISQKYWFKEHSTAPWILCTSFLA